MKFKSANENDFGKVKALYEKIIDSVAGRTDSVLWRKGVYPSDDFLVNAIEHGYLYVLLDGRKIIGAVVLNENFSPDYNRVAWSNDFEDDDLMIVHTLGIDPEKTKNGYGTMLVSEIKSLAKSKGKKAIRLDILSQNKTAELFYKSCGFEFVDEIEMYYPDTGVKSFRLFEFVF